ncbi:2-dehydropantoate 2-reductase [Scopulibacillus daqui]|uniref:2-dehydropantoate 2-reductase n=1 Tax=Scopulibacillus daqui TaxID=1469162 RepID=A0ABS2PXN1_9BACL|nr:2-dehydropantoate 2-reductase [Scopulibacillus daqui]MBM7644254.1 2-dehydropantoate 2-reductase [Scopulibacillus daqui]
MKVSIIGGGSVGLLFAGYLARDFQTTLYVRRNEQFQAVKENGIQIQMNDETFISRPRVAYSHEPWSGDLLIFAVKQPELMDMMASINKKAKADQSLLFIQNGMGHIDGLKHLHHHHIFLGVVEHGAKKSSDNHVAHNGAGRTQIAAFRGDFKIIHDLLCLPQFPFKTHTDWKEMLTKKLVVNAVINPLTALYRAENGQLINNPYYCKTMKQVFQETADILFSKKRCFSSPPHSKAKYWEALISICQNTSKNRSSMLQDLDACRKTEIEAISGYLIKEAERLGKPCPLTRWLYNSILGIEHEYLKKEGFDD